MVHLNLHIDVESEFARQCWWMDIDIIYHLLLLIILAYQLARVRSVSFQSNLLCCISAACLGRQTVFGETQIFARQSKTCEFKSPTMCPARSEID